ncbi:MAG: DUF1294 domain-containing protein [Bacteroidales bacterium]|nr:DUF1294 domain-containing protein [Bacteroidales bacterium]
MNTRLVLYYLLGVNLLTFIAYGIDKWKARRNGSAHSSRGLSRRIPEASLLLLALLGGSPAALVAMHLFRHKTLHKKFRYGVPAILFIQITIAVYLYFVL